MFKLFLATIFFVLSFSSFAKDTPTMSTLDSVKIENVQIISVKNTDNTETENNSEKFFGFVIASIIFALGVLAFLSLINRNKDFLDN